MHFYKSVRFKLSALIGMPFIVTLVFAGLFLQTQFAELTITNNISTNTHLIDQISRLVNKLQVERGTSSLVLSGGSPTVSLAERRSSSDQDFKPTEELLKKSSIKGLDEALAAFQKLTEIRLSVDAAQISPADVRKTYSGIIRSLLDVYPLVNRTSGRANAAFTTIILLEEAKESAGQFRAGASSVFAANTAIAISALENLIYLEGKMRSNLTSPALMLLPDDAKAIEDLKMHPGYILANEAAQAILEHYKDGNFGMDSSLVFNSLTEFIDALAELVLKNTNAVKEITASETARSKFTVLILSIILFLVPLIIGIISILVITRLMRTITTVQKGLATLAQGDGDLRSSLPIDSSDELGLLAQGFNDFIASMRILINDIRESSTALGNLAQDLSASMEETSASAQQISGTSALARTKASEQKGAATQAAGTINNISKEASAVNAAVERQVAALASSSSSIEEMVANVRSVTSIIERMSGEFDTLVQAASEGGTVINTAVQEVDKISTRSKKLQEANALIAAIAAQTNMLAMNAAIEAAHAGDAGRGFAVVAAEIRSLAENVAAQSKSIAGDVKGIGFAIHDVENATGASHKSFEGILKRISMLSQLSREISNAMSEQSEGSNQILQDLEVMKDISAEARQSAITMTRGSSSAQSDVENLMQASISIEDAMGQIAQGTEEVSTASADVTRMARKNQDGVEQVLERIGRFKT